VGLESGYRTGSTGGGRILSGPIGVREEGALTKATIRSTKGNTVLSRPNGSGEYHGLKRANTGSTRGVEFCSG
jgi:hypothetical protein